MSNPPVEVQNYGQSIWIDNIRRKLLDDGTFQKLIDEMGVVGVTSNPAIFQKAIGESDDYDETIANFLDLSPEEIYERLAVEDIQQATDLFMPIYEETNGRDGYVSLEVSPVLAHNTKGTIAEARRLFEAVGRPNVMIKIPATPEGIPAIEETIAAGINVNVTLIFAIENYIQVAEAFIRGLERRLDQGQDVSRIASVASFFLSRIDTLIDKSLENNIHASKIQGDTTRVQANNRLLGQIAVASAKLAYKRFQEMFYGERFARLREAGAWVQRPLWASTSTKNPTYPDTLYVDRLIGKDTVNTLPPNTLEAFADHGTASGETILEDIDEAESLLNMLTEVGIELDQITNRLQSDGVEAFATAFDELIRQVASKCDFLQSGVTGRKKMALGIYGEGVRRTMNTLSKEYFNSRLWNRDGSLWKDHAPTIARISNRLGWLDVLDTVDIDRLKALQASIQGSAYQHIVLLGMGGSSLCPEVLAQTFGPIEGFPTLLVLDSTHPAQIRRVESQIDITKTLFIVASKSGTTIETLSFYRYFYQKTGGNGTQFVAITDPDTPLVELAQTNGFRDTFLNPVDIGGRYSALSYFGMVPAALMGIDLDRFWGEARKMIEACGVDVPDASNPGLSLGTIIAALGAEGRDKIMVFASPSINSFGNWVEQLMAESLGKENRGFLPVVGTTAGRPHDHATDRLFIYLKHEGDTANAIIDPEIRALREAGHPRVTLLLEDRYALAGEFFRWEYATAVAGRMLQTNPFDEPNVTESKKNTARLLDYYREHRKLPETTPFLKGDNTSIYISEATLEPLKELGTAHRYNIHSRTELMAAQFAATHAGDYFAFLAYLPYTPEIGEAMETVRRRLRHVTHRAVTLGFGPRYLHSTGQFHKGGPNTGVFLMLTTDINEDLAIPGEDYTFGVLNAAQAAGDMEALEAHGRRVIRLHISGDVAVGIRKLIDAVDFVEARRR